MNFRLPVFLCLWPVVAFCDPPELEFSKWSAEVNVPDPVAISFDHQGRAYVTQTQRRKSQDLDIRNNRDWIPNDVGFQSVEEKRQFYLERLAPELSDQNKKRVDDLNEDGSHDWRDLMVLSEKIHVLEDTDNDGTADQISLFAEGFNTEITGIAAGVLWHDGDVFATVAPDVWRLRDSDDDGKADKRDVIAHGFGLHIAYAGHDMHGLTVGPDGKIYWSIGDKGISVETKDGRRFHYPNQGGVMRCYPDGSDFEVFAHGLRNVQELAFDEYGNLFGVDNDADKSGESERFVYIVQDMDAGWRANFQYRDAYNPWTDEGLWKPYFEDQPAYIVPPISNYIDGPAGFAYNPGTALSPEWRGYFFLTGAPNGNQHAFQVEPDGASFRMVNERQIGKGIPIVGINFAPDGALYGVDWGGGYPLNQKGAVWKIDVPGEPSNIRQETAELLRTWSDSKPTDFELKEYLEHPDQRIRLLAQFELVERDSLGFLIVTAREGASRLARIHAIWGLAQLFRNDLEQDFGMFRGLAEDSDPEIRAQAARMIGQCRSAAPTRQILLPLLSDASARVRFHAAMALGNREERQVLGGIVNLIQENEGQDLYLRHAGIFALSRCAESAELANLSNHPSEAVRVSAVVALRRQESPLVARFLDDESAKVATEAAIAIHDDWSIPEALPQLAAVLDDPKHRSPPLLRRAINANFRLGETKNAIRVAQFAISLVQPRELRLDALDALTAWVKPSVLDRIDGRRRSLDPRDVKAFANAITPALSEILSYSNDPEILEETLKLADQSGITLHAEALQNLLENPKAPGSLRAVALQILKTPEAIDYATASDVSELRIAAAEILVRTDKQRAAEFLATQLNGKPLAERQLAVSMLAGLGTNSANAILRDLAGKLEDGTLDPALQLDVLEAAEARDIEAALTRDPDDLLSNYLECLEGGDSVKGEEIFRNHIAAQCIRCHKIEDGKGSEIGPNLKGIGKEKDRRYLLESMVSPTATIAEGYGSVILTLKDKSTVIGQILKETESGLELRLPDGKTRTVKITEVMDRSAPISMMPPMVAILSKRELRDVVAFLASLKE